MEKLMNARNQLWNNIINGKRLYDDQLNYKNDNRSQFDMDHDRIVYSNSFRRLHDKTQVFPYAPLSSTNQARSRLSHSLEVSCVGRSLGILSGLYLQKLGVNINPYEIGTIIASACLAHDIGNPPFGHSGEDAIQVWCQKHISDKLIKNKSELFDLHYFEGNAQGFRTLTRLEAWQRKGGLRPTITTIGAFIKYPCSSSFAYNDDKVKNVSFKKYGIFNEDFPIFKDIQNSFNFNPIDPDESAFSRHPLAYLSEAADDICYSVIDLEDAYHLGIIDYKSVEDLLLPIAETDVNFNNDNDFENDLKLARLRSASINTLVNQVIEAFKENLKEIEQFKFSTNLVSNIKSKSQYKNIIDFSVKKIYNSQRVLEIECAGFQSIGGLLNFFIPAVLSESPNKEEKVIRQNIPLNFFKRCDIKYENRDDIGEIINKLSPYQRLLSVTDYISSMTDRYAIEIYQRMSGIKLPEF